MIIKESRLETKQNSGLLAEFITSEKYVDGYFLTIHDLHKLVRDFQVDNYDGFVSNDNAYIESWLKKHERIVKKD
jgi:hypothetical protein